MSKDKKLNNLLGMEDYTEKDFIKTAKTTKRTEVAKDVLQENAYVLGKNVLNDKLPNKEDHTKSKGLNNLISLDDFTKSIPATKDKVTKRTETAKDVLQEKKKAKCDDDCDEPKKGLSAKQKKLPEAMQKAILKKQGK